jgi:hypothetical protein
MWGQRLLDETEERATPSAERLMRSACDVFVDLAPRSPRFVPAALRKLLLSVAGIPGISAELVTLNERTAGLSDLVKTLAERPNPTSGALSPMDAAEASMIAGRTGLGRRAASSQPERLFAPHLPHSVARVTTQADARCCFELLDWFFWALVVRLVPGSHSVLAGREGAGGDVR